MSGAVDNLAKIRINGHEARMSGVINGGGARVIGNYVMPGWAPDSSMTAEFSETILESIRNNQKNGKKNVLEVVIMSDHSFMGLLIDKINASYTSDFTTSTSYGSWAEYGVIDYEIGRASCRERV